MGITWPFLIYSLHSFLQQWWTNWHSIETFLYLWQVVLALRAYLGWQEGVLGRCRSCLLTLQDREVTIITQTIVGNDIPRWMLRKVVAVDVGPLKSPVYLTHQQSSPVSDHLLHLHLPLSLRILSDRTGLVRHRVAGPPLRAAAVLPILRHHLAAVHRRHRLASLSLLDSNECS